MDLMMNVELPRLAAQRFGVTPEQLRPLSGGHFSRVYGFTRDGVDCVLRITPPDADLDAAAMRAVLSWVHTLDVHGAPVAGPILSIAGRLVETIELEARSYVVTAVRKAAGVLAEELPFEAWTDTLFTAWGRTAGRMHAIAQTYRVADPALARPEWHRIGSCFNEPPPDAPADAPIAERLAQVHDRIHTLPRDDGSYGMIHGDFHAANFFVDPQAGTLTLFDFDDCCRGWYVMDVAMAIFDMLVVYPHEDREAFAARFFRHFAQGYLRERPLDAVWAAQIPTFLKLLEINIHTQVAQAHNPADTTSWVGKFMANDRRGRIERGVPYVDVDFAALLEGCRP